MNRTTKLASILSIFTASLAMSGCYFQGTLGGYIDDPAPVVDDPPPVTNVPAAIVIDSDAAMEAYPGEGVGIYVQYAYGGHWTVFTTCDTLYSDVSCNFDLLIEPEPGLSLWNVSEQDLDSADTLSFYDDSSVNLVTRTTYGMDGVSFDADPGASIRIDVMVDGVARPEFVYVVSNGQVLDGVPTNPADFYPDSF
jgi:hypothetical protein